MQNDAVVDLIGVGQRVEQIMQLRSTLANKPTLTSADIKPVRDRSISMFYRVLRGFPYLDNSSA